MAVITPSDALANTLLTTLRDALDSGASGATLAIYTGTKPATPDVAVNTETQKLLGTLTCAETCGTVASRALTFGAITQDAAADYTGTATWGRFRDSNGNAHLDVDCSTTGGSGFLQMNTTNIIAGGPISCTSCVISI